MDNGSKRAPNWTEAEKSYCLELISVESDVLFGTFRGATQGGKLKKTAWEGVCKKLNASGMVTNMRSVDEIKTMWRNAKGRVKEKVDKSKMTGAGVIEPLTACEEFVSNHMYANNQCQLLGIPGGSETATYVAQSLPSGQEITRDDGLIVLHLDDNMNM
ncbi:uncharacterized protein LOC128244090 [Mya arenaria]|uniref:uncharacterized protein LOC128244090 n=1 Tax=Mya arenaria TaxID=6604 RepID=UPI0022E048DE|nr:uncharacterized protein LOC128244090 [Mya arenaria]